MSPANRDAPNPSLKRIIDAIIDPEAVGVESPDQFLGAKARENLGQKLNAMIHGPAAALFQGGVALDMDVLCKPIQPGRVPLNVVYLNALVSDAQKQFLVSSLAAEIYRWMVTTGGDPTKPKLLVYLDEARDYMPAGNYDPPAKQPMLRLFRQARKYGVGCIVCTQSPRSVDHNAFSNASTKIIGRLESAQDVERVKEWFATGGPAPSWIAARQGASAGTFVGRWPGMDSALEGVVFQSRPLFTLHEGAWAPDRLRQELADNDIRRAVQDEFGPNRAT